MSAYRWHLTDPVPFQRSLRLDIEHKGWTYNADGAVKSAFEERPDLFSSVAFWYQAGIATDQPTLAYGSRRLPIGNARQIEVENSLGEVKAEGGTVSVEKDVFWSKDILLFAAKGPGSKVTIPFDVPEDGRYEVVAQVAHSSDYGTYVTELDGKSTASAEALEHEPGANVGSTASIDAYFPEIYVAEDHLIGWARLSKGRHTLTFVCAGKNSAATGYNLGIDTLIVASLALPDADTAGARAADIRAIGERGEEPSASDVARLLAAAADREPEAREAAIWTIGQVTAATPRSIDAVLHALTDSDSVVRGLAAIALRNAGRAAAPARDALLARLSDDEVGVRMVAAQALGRLRDPSLIDPLIAACRVPDQHVHVLRSLADALGDLGPQAARAVPTLRELSKMPRVAWAANAAIKKIESH
jgi:hypothetical protein